MTEPGGPAPADLAAAGKTVQLLFPTDGHPRIEFMNAVNREMGNPHSPLGGYQDFKSGPVLPISRSELCRMFLRTPFEWAWMVDTDIVFTPQTLPTLLAHADPETRPIIGAVYYGMVQGKQRPIMYRAGETPEGKFSFAMIEKWPRDKLLQVDATGCGCLLVHRSVFKRMSEARPDDDGVWFAMMTIDGTIFGEDMAFCVRAAMAGIPVFVHSGVTVGHMKTIMLGKPAP